MKKWTVVIELSMEDDDTSTTFDMHGNIGAALAMRGYNNFRIMETIPAPYGPQFPDGVFIADSGRKGNFRQ